MLIENQLNILYQDKIRLLNYLKKVIIKLSLLIIFYTIYKYLTFVLSIR